MTNYTPPCDHQRLYICSWIAPARQKCLALISALNSPGVLVVVVTVVGAVDTERGGCEVGGTAEDEEEGEDVADSAAVGGKKEKHDETVPIRALERCLC